ncbi:MAG: phosphoglycerate kinase, partial [Gemmatimonadota bacterium]|nr:phosphoglycerate kinase [Gemmatimonadota bacterium]
FRALGLETGNSLVEEDRIGLAKGLLARASENGRDLRLPVDGVVASAFDADADASVVPVGEIPVDRWMLDVGPETVAEYRKVILGARTVLWNGPMGVFEMDRFAEGTLGIARAMAEATDLGATTIIGGGDSAAAIAKAACADRVSHVSTGGGASLEFLEGKLLPGVAALTEVNS